MNWREGSLAQARSDHEMFLCLNRMPVEQCHRLHYFQMATEKLAKAVLCGRHARRPPPTSHTALVRMLQVIKTRPEIRRGLGFEDPVVFNRYVQSLLELARQIESLAPALAGTRQPNTEYPWEDVASQTVVAPALFAFTDLHPGRPRMAKLESLIRRLLKILR
jgi:hypothetical protein